MYETQCVHKECSAGHTHDIAGFAVSLLFHGIKGLPSELGTTGHADEAVHVEDLVHGGTTRPFTDHILPTARTPTCKIQQWNYCMDADGKLYKLNKIKK